MASRGVLLIGVWFMVFMTGVRTYDISWFGVGI